MQSNKLNVKIKLIKLTIDKIKETLKSNNYSDCENIDFENFLIIWEFGENQINQEKNFPPLNN
jgi:hypothetical protein